MPWEIICHWRTKILQVNQHVKNEGAGIAFKHPFYKKHLSYIQKAMTPTKYLNGVLTVIAFCLLLITLAITGLIPSASAKSNSPSFANVPLNKDGSMNVRLVNSVVDVNVQEVGRVTTAGTIDVNVESLKIDQRLNVNIEEVNGRSVNMQPLPVTIEKQHLIFTL